MGGGRLSSVFFFVFFFTFGCLLLLKKIDVFPLKGGSGGPSPENFGKSKMQESLLPHFLGLFFIFLFFVNQFSLFFSAIL